MNATTPIDEARAAHPDKPAGPIKIVIADDHPIFRDGLQKLRSKLVPQMAALTLMGLLTVLGLRYHAERTALQRDERALALVTASDTANLCLASALGVPTETHARYCGRARAVMAVVTFSHFSPTPAGQSYHAWVRHGEKWTSLGTA